MLVFDARLQVAVDRLDEVLAMKARVKAQYGAAEHALRISRRQGQMPKDSGFGHGMCQKLRMVARGSRSRIIAGSNAK